VVLSRLRELNIDDDQDMTQPSAAALDMLVCAAKLGLRLRQEGGTLTFGREWRAISPWVASKFEETRLELSEYVPDLGQSNDCLVPLRPVAHAAASLVCVHPVNGGSFDYQHIARSMPEAFSVYGCDALDGLLALQPDVSFDAMTNRYVNALLASRLGHQPLALFGGSSGGMIALEMARRMAMLGAPPVLVILGDTRDPISTPVYTHYRRKRLEWNAFIEGLLPREMWDVYPPEHEFWKLEVSERLAYLRDRLTSLQDGSGILAALDPLLMEDYFTAFRRHLECYGQWVARPYFGRALFLKASQTPDVTNSQVFSMLQGDARIHSIEGMHHLMYWPPAASEVSTAIGEAISDALAGTNSEVAHRSRA